MIRSCFFLTIALAILSPANAATDAELKETMATFINLNGLLCAKVTNIRPLKLNNKFEVMCIEYRGGAGTVRYIFDGNTGIAFKTGS